LPQEQELGLRWWVQAQTEGQAQGMNTGARYEIAIDGTTRTYLGERDLPHLFRFALRLRLRISPRPVATMTAARRDSKGSV
jgi:hypothetical protein